MPKSPAEDAGKPPQVPLGQGAGPRPSRPLGLPPAPGSWSQGHLPHIGLQRVQGRGAQQQKRRQAHPQQEQRRPQQLFAREEQGLVSWCSPLCLCPRTTGLRCSTKDQPWPWGWIFCSATWRPSRTQYRWSMFTSHTQGMSPSWVTPVVPVPLGLLPQLHRTPPNRCWPGPASMVAVHRFVGVGGILGECRCPRWCGRCCRAPWGCGRPSPTAAGSDESPVVGGVPAHALNGAGQCPAPPSGWRSPRPGPGARNPRWSRAACSSALNAVLLPDAVLPRSQPASSSKAAAPSGS